MHKAWLAAIGIALSGSVGVSSAQTLEVPETTATAAAVDTPVRGMSMAAVETRYGAPAQRYDAVGQPPITRWVYPSFVVYFEYSHVVHAVAIRAAAGTP